MDTGALVAEVVELLAPGEGGPVEVEPEMPTLEAERVPLQQVFMNLIGNAVKYGGAGRGGVRVRVEWRAVARRLRVRGRRQRARASRPSTTSASGGSSRRSQARDKVEGTGIGLSVVKKIVETRGGEYGCESAPGEGATFHFTWPRVPRTPITTHR